VFAMRTSPRRVRTARRLLAVAMVGALSIPLSGGPTHAQSPTGPPGGSDTPRVLVFHAGAPTDIKDAGITAIRQAGRGGPGWQRFDAEATGDAAVFTDRRLRRYNTVVFLGVAGDRLNPAQEATFQRYVRSGGGFVGIGDAARAEPESPWVTQLIGSRPASSGPADIQRAVVEVADRTNPATRDLPLEWRRTDRWLNWDPNPAGEVHTVAWLRESSYQPGEGANGVDHPISWCRDFDGGRSFYTGMGNTARGYREPAFRRHLQGALLWTSRLVRADCTATIAANYQATRLTGPNQPGQLDQIGEPHGMAVAGDGRVLYIGRGGGMDGGPAPVTGWDDPDTGLGEGTVHVWDPRTREVTKAASLAVFGNWGFSFDDLTKSEEGLVGIAVDPNFLRNGWVYLHYTPHSRIDRETHVGERRVSRFTLDHRTNLIDLSSERVLLKWSIQIHSCCHAGGDMAFDSRGNLYIAAGDNNSSSFTDGYSGNNPEPNFLGLSFADARRTAGNTNSLNGKILRIHPERDGTYTIPRGNLFTGHRAVPGRTRPEIYVMGVRNPSRISMDPQTDALTVGWVGPDAFEPSPVWGPAKYDQFAYITEAGNYGWPFCMANQQPYRDRGLADPTQPLEWYDCDHPRNESPNNTGLVNLPPARGTNIWYSPQGGAPDYPRDAEGVPSYELAEEIDQLPWLVGGFQAAMDGPIYRYDGSNPSRVKWPRYWDGKWFIADFFPGDLPRHAVLMDPDNADRGGLPVHADNLDRIVLEQPDAIWNLMAWEFGPDGALYVLNYGDGFFNASAASALWRVTYVGSGPTPAAGDLVPGVPGAVQH
jgi:glucose/arabinose dehydrogenase/type 1 glutamine amidotransferase